MQDDKAAMDMAALTAFVERLIDERKDPNINSANRDQVKNVLLNQLNQEINTHLVNRLPDKDQMELDTLLDKDPTDAQLSQFFAEKIPNLDIEIATALMNFRAAYLYPLKQVLDNAVAHTEKAGSTSSAQMPPPLPPAPVAPKKVN